MYELHCQDALQFMATLPDGAVDAVITDPPYGIGVEIVSNNRERWQSPPVVKNEQMAWDAKRIAESIPDILRVSRHQVIFGGNYYADLLPPSSSWIVWDKMNSGVFADCELAWTSHDKAVRQYRYMWDGFRKQMPEERYHPTQKPLSLMIWVLENYTQPGDLVFDPFAGSGTTGVACIKTDRNFIGCEISPHYHAIASKRLADAAAQLRLPLG